MELFGLLVFSILIIIYIVYLYKEAVKEDKKQKLKKKQND
jgi:cbb3-type cytochrome oxidase subunit 3